MPVALLESLHPALSDESPCGPDLEIEGDADFMSFLASAEGTLPSSFFIVDKTTEDRRPLEKSDFQFGDQIAAGLALLKRARDLRILGFLAVFAALERRLDDLVDIYEATADLLKNHWEQVNPREQGDAFALRLAALERFDDNLIAQPLQFTTLIRHPRFGNLSYRQKLLADGASPLAGEQANDPVEQLRAFAKIPIEEIIALRDRIARFVAACDALSNVTAARLGARSAFKFKRVQPLVSALLAFLEGIVAERDPGAAAAVALLPANNGETAPSGVAPPPGALASPTAVAAALAGVIAYFEKCEPSNPALLLLKQAQRLIGMHFLEIMRILAPDHFDSAVFGIGRTHRLDLTMPRLNEQFAAAPASGETSAPEAVAVADRNAAIALIQQIEAFYARSEPSSPVPFLCEKARGFCASDFLTILRQILPDDALKTKE